MNDTDQASPSIDADAAVQQDESKLPTPAPAPAVIRKTYRGKKRPLPNREHRIELPKELRSGVLAVSADVHIREWRRDGRFLIVVPSAVLTTLVIASD